MLTVVQSIVAKQLNKRPTEVKPSLTFAQLGADDLDLVEITMEVEETRGITIQDDDLLKIAGITKAEDLCMRLTISDFTKVAESAQPYPKQPTKNEVNDGNLRESQVGVYGELSRLPNPKGLVLVFVPSFEDAKRLSEERLGRVMNDDELESLKQKSAVIALPPEMADKLSQIKAARQATDSAK